MICYKLTVHKTRYPLIHQISLTLTPSYFNETFQEGQCYCSLTSLHESSRNQTSLEYRRYCYSQVDDFADYYTLI